MLDGIAVSRPHRQEFLLREYADFADHPLREVDADSVLRPVPCIDEHPLSRFFIFNDVLSRPEPAKFSHTFFCIVARMHCLYELQGSIALHFVDAKERTQSNSDLGNTYGGTTEAIITAWLLC